MHSRSTDRLNQVVVIFGGGAFEPYNRTLHKKTRQFRPYDSSKNKVDLFFPSVYREEAKGVVYDWPDERGEEKLDFAPVISKSESSETYLDQYKIPSLSIIFLLEMLRRQRKVLLDRANDLPTSIRSPRMIPDHISFECRRIQKLISGLGNEGVSHPSYILFLNKISLSMMRLLVLASDFNHNPAKTMCEFRYPGGISERSYL